MTDAHLPKYLSLSFYNFDGLGSVVGGGGVGVDVGVAGGSRGTLIGFTLFMCMLIRDKNTILVPLVN